jgi:hypothetical protein
MPDQTRRVIASSPNGTILGGLDVPSLPSLLSGIDAGPSRLFADTTSREPAHLGEGPSATRAESLRHLLTIPLRLQIVRFDCNSSGQHAELGGQLLAVVVRGVALEPVMNVLASNWFVAEV